MHAFPITKLLVGRKALLTQIWSVLKQAVKKKQKKTKQTYNIPWEKKEDPEESLVQPSASMLQTTTAL